MRAGIPQIHFPRAAAGVVAVAAIAAVWTGHYVAVSAVALPVLAVLAVAWCRQRSLLAKKIQPQPPHAAVASAAIISVWTAQCMAATAVTMTMPALMMLTAAAQQAKVPHAPKFHSKRPAPLNLQAPIPQTVSPSTPFVTPRSSPLSPECEDVFLSPGPTLLPHEILVDGKRVNKALFIPAIPEYVTPTFTAPKPLEELTTALIELLASANWDDAAVQEKVKKQMKELWDAYDQQVFGKVRELYRTNAVCHKQIDAILENPKVFSLIQRAMDHLPRFFGIAQAEVFELFGQKNYDVLIGHFLKALEQRNSSAPGQTLNSPLRQKLIALVEFLATTWTVSFVKQTTRTRLGELLTEFALDDPKECLRELRSLYLDKTSPVRKHIDTLLKPSKLRNPDFMLKKQMILKTASLGAALAGEVIGMSIQDICALLGRKQYKELMQKFLVLEPTDRMKKVKQFFQANSFDPEISFA